MLQVEPIQSFNGFGTGKQPGEYFFSQGFQRSQFGITPRMSIVAAANSGVLTSLQLLNWFAQGNFTNDYIYGFALDGKLFRGQIPAVSWTHQRTVSVDSHGNGLIFDQKNRLLYANDQYLGMSEDGSSFDDDWKDFELTTTDFRPMDLYEDSVLIGNKNQVALLNITDDSFNANAFNIPEGFHIRCLKSGKNGILLGANFNNRGALILWDSYSDRSIAPWIWRNRNIQSIVPTDEGWIVFTQDEIFFTNGYSVQSLTSEFPDFAINDDSLINNLAPQGADVRGSKLLFWGTSSRLNRQKCGLYVLDLTTRLLEFLPVSNGATYQVIGSAIFCDTSNFTHLSYQSAFPLTKFIGRLTNSAGAHAVLISEQLGQSENEKVAEGVKLTFGVSSYQATTPNLTFDVSAKVCNARQNIFGWGVTNAISASGNLLRVDGTLRASSGINIAKVGDEVTILEGVNAGKVKHIISIANQNANNETWTLDSTLTSNTESECHFNVAPFKLARKYSLSNLEELKELYFDVQNRIKGKKFFVKLLLENLPPGFMPELKGGQFIYEELTFKR